MPHCKKHFVTRVLRSPSHSACNKKEFWHHHTNGINLEALVGHVDVVLRLEERGRDLPLLQPLVGARRRAVQHRLLQVLLQAGQLRGDRHQVRDGLKRLKSGQRELVRKDNEMRHRHFLWSTLLLNKTAFAAITYACFKFREE